MIALPRPLSRRRIVISKLAGMTTPATIQFGLRTLFVLTTLCGITLAFVLARGAAAAVIALPLAAAGIAVWCCVRQSLQSSSLALRCWYLLGAGLSFAMAAIAVGITIAQ
jgi:hypothetical protein